MGGAVSGRQGTLPRFHQVTLSNQGEPKHVDYIGCMEAMEE